MVLPLTIGLDIGSTKLVAALVTRHGTAKVVLTSQQEQSKKFCLAFDHQERLFADAAEFQFIQNPENTIYGRGECLSGILTYLLKFYLFPFKMSCSCLNLDISMKWTPLVLDLNDSSMAAGIVASRSTTERPR